MDRETLINIISTRMKLVRVESGHTQEYMAHILGISKKTLIQIEKERIKASWTIVVALCVLFPKSEIIKHILGEDIVGNLLKTAYSEEELQSNKFL